ncbi:MAG: hypothetical protein ABL901_01030 [Hyphomicrobiaceae bacterium]
MSRAEDDAIAAAMDAASVAQLAAAPKAKPPPPPPTLAVTAQQAADWIRRADRDWVKITPMMRSEARALLPVLDAALLREAAKPKPAQRTARKAKPKRKPRKAAR